jgi:hypothetical protein
LLAINGKICCSSFPERLGKYFSLGAIQPVSILYFIGIIVKLLWHVICI